MWSAPHVSSEHFREWVEEAIESLPGELRESMSNVAIVVDEDAPAEQNVLGLYQGIPLTRRNSGYAAVPPDKITIFRRPIERVTGGDPERLRAEVHHVVIHEIAHHFGISDERLIELGKY
jgi:predicted Zn-dependent protease with MMP-like domain